jgi:hypothetical protein
MSATNKKDRNPENPTLEQFETFKEEVKSALQVMEDKQTGFWAKLNGIEENMGAMENRMREAMEAMENRMMAALERSNRDPPKIQKDNTSTATPGDEDTAQSGREEKVQREDYAFEDAVGHLGQLPDDSGEESVEDPRDSGVTNRSKYRARNSVGGNLARDTERRDPRLAYNQPVEAGRRQVQQMVTIPPPNFYLKNISPDKVMTFLRQWREYCLKYDTYVNPLTVVHQSILRRLARKHGFKDQDISSLSATQMHDLLEQECEITSPLMFVREFETSLKFIKTRKWADIKPSNHEFWWNDLLYVAEKARDHFSFMVRHNKSSVIPKVEGHYGSAKVFYDLIDPAYNDKVKPFMGKLSDFKTFNDFVTKYLEIAEEHYKQAIQILNWDTYDDPKYQRKDFADMSKEIRFYNRKTTWASKGSKYERGDPEDPDLHSSLNHIAGSDSGDEIDERTRADMAKTCEDIVLESALEDFKLAEEVSDDVDDSDYVDPDIAGACQEQHLAAMLPATTGGSKQHDATKPRDLRDEREGMAGCMYYALYGTCVKGMTCKYASSHNREGAKKTREWIARQSAKQDRLASGSVKKVFSAPRR